MIGDRKISHFYSSEPYGKHVSEALNAVDRRVDDARTVVPISATEIRSNPYLNRRYLDPLVYRDLLTRVVFVDAMSTGKSTIVEALAKKYKTTFASEYGREYWTNNHIDRRIRIDEFDIIARQHLINEDLAALEADRVLFVDTNAITTYMYCLDYHGTVPDYLKQTALENGSRYDLFFLCEDDIPYDDTWDRSGPQKRRVFQKQFVADLLERRIPFIRLSGNLAQRIAKVDAVLEAFRKFDNFLGSKVLD